MSQPTPFAPEERSMYMNGEIHSGAKRMTFPSLTSADSRDLPSTSRQRYGAISFHLVGSPFRSLRSGIAIVPSSFTTTLVGCSTLRMDRKLDSARRELM